MATVKYSTRVKEYLRSLTGIDDFSSAEEGFLKSAFNRRVRMAYEESRLWPRYLKEELRLAGFDNVVPTEQGGYDEIDTFIDIQSVDPRTLGTTPVRYDWVVRSDGAKILNLAYVDQQDVQYTANPTTVNSGELEDISSGGARAYAISFWMRTTSIPTDYGSASKNTTLLVINGDGTATPSGNAVGGLYLSIDHIGNTAQIRNSWQESEGTSMDVYGDGLYLGVDYGNGDAGIQIQNAFDTEWHHFIWTFQPSDTGWQNTGAFHYELNGDTGRDDDIEIEIADVRVYAQKIDANLAWYLYTNPNEIYVTPLWSSNLPEFWVSYKAALTTTYGDGSGETDDVPLEFFEYGVHGAYADWLRGEGQNDKAIAEESFAAQHLERQLEKIQYTNGSPYLWSRFSTHGTRQRR